MFRVHRIIDYCNKTFQGRFGRTDKAIKTLRSGWGKELLLDRDFHLISLYFRLLPATETGETIEEKTWSDLNMDDIFAKLDRNVSAIGRQYLYCQLRRYTRTPATLKTRFDLYALFMQSPELREHIQLALMNLSDNNASFIPNVLYKPLPTMHRRFYGIYAASLCFVLSSIFALYYAPFLFAAAGFAIINIIITRIFDKRVFSFSSEFHYLHRMLIIAEKLASSKMGDGIPQFNVLHEEIAVVTVLKKKLSWFAIDKLKLNELIGWIVDYLNVFCLLNLISFIRSVNNLRQNQSSIARVYEALASMDASISIASYLSESSAYCMPHFNEKNTITVEGSYHPLLQNPVSNSFSLCNKSALITGSNMAGKTTFIKTIGMNVILAQTAAFCLAEKADIPFLIVKSSIKREDNLQAGKSYYFTEVEEILEFVHSGDTQARYLFLIDEIFRGTNTVERIATSVAVLKFLGNKNITLVTTHDIELQELLRGMYEMYHFNEQVGQDKYFFDYTIKPGPCSSRNAIKLLELRGYPDSITQYAHALAAQFAKNGFSL